MQFDLEKISARRSVLAFVSVALLICIVLADYATGFELSLSALYLAPVAVITLAFGQRAGIAMAFVAYGAWIVVNSSNAISRNRLPIVVWEWGIRFATAVAFVVLLAKLTGSLEHEMRRSRRDPLTRLPNRRAFLESLESERRRDRRYGRMLSIAYIDVDDFKLLNDRHGHSVGDRALRAMGATMRRHLRHPDLLARLGGDEFALVYVETTAADAMRAVALLRERLLALVEKHHWPVSFSIGLASFETVPETVEEMIEAADTLMYETKKQAKGSVRHRVFRPSGGSTDR